MFKYAPNQPEAHYFQGKLHVEAGEKADPLAEKLTHYQAGMASYNQAIEVDDNRAEMFRDRAVLHYALAEALKLKDPTGKDPETIRQTNEHVDMAFADMAQSIKRYPTDPLAYFYRGQWFMNAGRPEQAIKDFELSLKLDPSLEAEYERLGFR